jgi:O-acetyl-ADP-ribose deacetylase (regulator of RNase III)
VMRVNFHGITLEIIQGNIAEQKDIEVVVNASHAGYKADGGVSAAIHAKAGPELYEHCKLLVPLKPGHSVLTPAFNLPNKCIIHCLGPHYGADKAADKLLAHCYTHALELADRHALSSIAFPAISTGALGYPIRDAAFTSLSAIIDQTAVLRHIKFIRLVVYTENDMDIFQNILIKLLWNKRIITHELTLH